jgi:hypothetical protein
MDQQYILCRLRAICLEVNLRKKYNYGLATNEGSKSFSDIINIFTLASAKG